MIRKSILETGYAFIYYSIFALVENLVGKGNSYVEVQV